MNNLDQTNASSSTPDPDDLPNATFEYGSTCVATMPELPIIDDESAFEDEDTGYDPYNSGSFDTTKWRGEKS